MIGAYTVDRVIITVFVIGRSPGEYEEHNLGVTVFVDFSVV
jgi:hypothetical protein